MWLSIFSFFATRTTTLERTNSPAGCGLNFGDMDHCCVHAVYIRAENRGGIPHPRYGPCRGQLLSLFSLIGRARCICSSAKQNRCSIYFRTTRLCVSPLHTTIMYRLIGSPFFVFCISDVCRCWPWSRLQTTMISSVSFCLSLFGDVRLQQKQQEGRPKRPGNSSCNWPLLRNGQLFAERPTE